MKRFNAFLRAKAVTVFSAS